MLNKLITKAAIAMARASMGLFELGFSRRQLNNCPKGFVASGGMDSSMPPFY